MKLNLPLLRNFLSDRDCRFYLHINNCNVIHFGTKERFKNCSSAGWAGGEQRRLTKFQKRYFVDFSNTRKKDIYSVWFFDTQEQMVEHIKKIGMVENL